MTSTNHGLAFPAARSSGLSPFSLAPPAPSRACALRPRGGVGENDGSFVSAGAGRRRAAALPASPGDGDSRGMIDTLPQQKTLPHSEESERAVLGGILLDPAVLPTIAGRLRP